MVVRSPIGLNHLPASSPLEGGLPSSGRTISTANEFVWCVGNKFVTKIAKVTPKRSGNMS